MRSIRTSMIYQQLAAIVILYAISSTLVFLLIGSYLQDKFDADLAVWAETLTELFDFEDPEADLSFHNTFFDQGFPGDEVRYYQVWDTRKKTVARSLSLYGADLIYPELEGKDHIYVDLELPDGKEGRGLAFSYINAKKDDLSGKESENELVFIMACSQEWLDTFLQMVLIALAGIGGLLSLGSLWVIPRVVASGLSPLHIIAQKAKLIDAASLEQRFVVVQLPEELQPIGNKLNNLLERLNKSFVREKRFTANVSHELRTPIAELRALSEVGLAAADDDSALYKACLRDAHDIALQMQNLTTSLLALTRLDAGSIKTKVEEIHLNTLLDKTIQNYAREISEREITVTIEGNENIILTSDKTLVETLLANLVSNAVSYAPIGSSVYIVVGKNSEGMKITFSNPAGELTERDLDDMFEPLWRKENSRSDNTHSGLGLALVTSYCQLLNFSLYASIRDGMFHIEVKEK